MGTTDEHFMFLRMMAYAGDDGGALHFGISRSPPAGLCVHHHCREFFFFSFFFSLDIIAKKGGSKQPIRFKQQTGGKKRQVYFYRTN